MPPKRLTDKQLFKRHRRVAIDPTPREADIDTSWHTLDAQQKRTEAARIRTALASGTQLAAVPMLGPLLPLPPPPPPPPPPAPPLPFFLTPEQDQSQDYDASSGESNAGDADLGAAVIIAAAPLPPPDDAASDAADPPPDPDADRRAARKIFGEQNAPDYAGLAWQQREHVGSGTFGTCHLWVSGNDTDRIARRIVVKDAWVRDPDLWGSVKTWHGDPRDAAARMPAEICAMIEMQNKPGSNRVIGYHTHSVSDTRNAYRVIMPYCPHKSLTEIVNWYRADGRNIPEPFIWSVFDSMTEACLLMENGTTAKVREAPLAWQIVHKDIKIDNTFLDARDPNNFPSYPRAVIGDFGACVLTRANDIMNPNHFADNAGTYGYMTPEQTQFINRVTKQQQLVSRLQGWTTVYQVGKTIACLMKKEHDPDGPQWLEPWNADDGPIWPPKPIFTAAENNTYSQDLRDLVGKCLRYTPSRRITAKRLKGKIVRRTRIRNGGVDRAAGLRSNNTNPVGPNALRGWRTFDQYAIGMALDPDSETESE